MSKIIEQPRYSCAISAQQVVLAIPGAHPILHSGPGCSERSTFFHNTAGGLRGTGYTGGSHISCTNSTQREIVFGGIPKLRDTISGALKVIDSDLFVVLTGCTAEIVGDDVISTASDFVVQGYPVVAAETAGFKGSIYYGYSEVIKAIINQYVGDAKPKVEKGLVNVFSVVPYQNPFWEGDLQEIKSLLESIGLNVNILFGSGSGGASEWKTIPNAEFNILISPWVGKDVVELLEKKYGTPFLQFPYIPVGAGSTSDFLRKVGEFAGIEREFTERVIASHEKTYYSYFTELERYLVFYQNEFPWDFITVGDANYSIGVSSFLTNELGLKSGNIYITEDLKKKYEAKIRDLITENVSDLDGEVIFEIDGGKIQTDIKKNLIDETQLILGSTWEKLLARENNKYYVPLSLPMSQNLALDESYVGYRGGLQLIREIAGDVLR